MTQPEALWSERAVDAAIDGRIVIDGQRRASQSGETEDEAVALANRSPYGLQASVWSHDINHAHRVAHALRAGTVRVSPYDEDDITVPFGGNK